MALFCGLGNPELRYQNTPHNVGFLLADEVARRHSASWSNASAWSAHVARISLGEQTHWLIKPQTYMNLSGEALSAVARFHKIPPEECLVGVDDIELPAGTLRPRASGGTGGHNGLKSIEQHLGTQDYPRLRIGIAPVPRPPAEQLADYVLRPMRTPEKEQILMAVRTAGELINEFFLGGFEALLKRYSQLFNETKTQDSTSG